MHSSFLLAGALPLAAAAGCQSVIEKTHYVTSVVTTIEYTTLPAGPSCTAGVPSSSSEPVFEWLPLPDPTYSDIPNEPTEEPQPPASQTDSEESTSCTTGTGDATDVPDTPDTPDTPDHPDHPDAPTTTSIGTTVDSTPSPSEEPSAPSSDKPDEPEATSTCSDETSAPVESATSPVDDVPEPTTTSDGDYEATTSSEASEATSTCTDETTAPVESATSSADDVPEPTTTSESESEATTTDAPEEPATTSEAPEEPATTSATEITSEAPEEPATTSAAETTSEEPAPTSEAPEEPATSEAPEEPATSEAPEEPATTSAAETTSEAPEEPATTSAAETTSEAPEEPATTSAPEPSTTSEAATSTTEEPPTETYVRQYPADIVDELQDESMEKLKEWLSQNNSNGCTLEKATVRREWGDMSVEQRHDYIDSVLCLQSTPSIYGSEFPAAQSRFDDFVVAHMTQTNYIHGTANFLTWHRYFLHEFEKALKNECGYKGAMPYWNWDRYAEDPENSPLFNGDDASLGGNSVNGCVQSGPFKDMTVNLGPGPNTRRNARCLNRDISKTAAYYTRVEITYPLITQYNDVTSFQDKLQSGNNVHAAGHHTVGGNPGSDIYTSPGDPYFHLHHAGVDRLYWIWQLQDLNSRLSQVGGTNTRTNRPGSLTETMNLGKNAGDVELQSLLNTMGGLNGELCYVYY